MSIKDLKILSYGRPLMENGKLQIAFEQLTVDFETRFVVCRLHAVGGLP
jgi:hypothetical protein